jgi:aquaporin Z
LSTSYGILLNIKLLLPSLLLIKTNFMRNYITEFIGTFFLVFVVGMVVLNNTGAFAPIAIGSVLMVMIFAGGHISGAHYNPAVTLAVLIRGKIGLTDAIIYMIAQILAAVVAGLAVSYFLADNLPLKAPVVPDTVKVIIAEFIATFALAYVVLNVATARGNAGNSFYGLAIGFTVLCMAYAVGNISGAFNPAVAIGVCYMKLSSWSDIWAVLIGSFAGGAIAGLVFNYLNREEKAVPPIQKN